MRTEEEIKNARKGETMRTEEEIKNARKVVNKYLANPNLSKEQVIVLSGMSTALQWVCEQGGVTLDRLISGEPISTWKQ